MPFSGDIFQALPPPAFPAVALTPINSADYNSVINDLIGGLTTVKQGNTTTADRLGRVIKNPIDNYGAVGDGVADDTTAVNAALNSGFDIDGAGGTYAVSSTVTVGSSVNRLVRRLHLIAVGSTLNATTPMLTLASTTRNTFFEDCTIDGKKFAAGVNVIGGRNQLIGCEVFNFKGYGIWFNSGGSSDAKAINCSVYEYSNGDTEFATDANFTSDGIRFSRADVMVMDCIVRWTKNNLNFQSGAQTIMVENCHLYNGGSGVLTRQHAKNILGNTGTSNISISNCYLDNGEIDLYSPSYTFTDCKALWSPSGLNASYFIALFANGQTGPYQFQAQGWQDVSSGLTDGTIPFLSFPGFGPNTWSGDYSHFIAATGVHNAAENIRETRLQVDSDPIRAYYGPGNKDVGVGICLIDSDTANFNDYTRAPGLRSSGNYLKLQGFADQVINVSSAYTVLQGDSGSTIYVDTSGGAVTITISSGSLSGFKVDIVQTGTNVVTVVLSGAGTLNALSGTAPWQTTGRYGVARVRVAANTAGNSPTVILSGDIA